MTFRSKRYLKAAKGQPCVRCGVCNGTTVAAHYQGYASGHFGKGKGVKPSDLLVADLCATCHDDADNYRLSSHHDPWVRKIEHSDEFFKLILITLHRRIEQKILKCDTQE